MIVRGRAALRRVRTDASRASCLMLMLSLTAAPAALRAQTVQGHARQLCLPLRGAHALHCLRNLGLHHEVDDALAEFAVGRIG